MKTLLTDLERQKIFEKSQETLWEGSDDANEAIAYLKETRGLPEKVIKELSFGYCPQRSRHDWAGRLIMPLIDQYGKLVILTTRDFRATEDTPMPHLHEEFDKRRYLYGLNAAKPHILERNKVFVVEGQFDVGQMITHEIPMTVGVLGSSFTFEHVCLLRRYCSEFYLAFDNDRSGLLCIERAMEMYEQKCLRSFGTTFIPIHLPDAKDPDEYLKKYGKHAFLQLAKESKEKALDEQRK